MPPHAPPLAKQLVVPLLSQQPPLQTLPGQQGWPAAPHAAQTPFLHAIVVSLQLLLPQHGWPAAPQAVQVLLPPQTIVAELQPRPVQQGWPLAPQATQLVPSQPTDGAVQRPP